MGLSNLPFPPFVLPDTDYLWLVTACWDGQNRRVRHWCRTKQEAFAWCGWGLNHEPETMPEVVSSKKWFGGGCEDD